MSLFRYFSLPPNIYLDVLIQSVQVGSKIRMVTMESQKIPQGLYVSCSRSLRDHYPIGTIFQIDCRIVRSNNRKAFVRLLRYQQLTLSLDFFEHNRKLQKAYPTQTHSSLFNTTT